MKTLYNINLAKVEAEGSNPFTRSIFSQQLLTEVLIRKIEYFCNW